MTIDLQIEVMRNLLNTEIAKNGYSLTANALLHISQKLDELLTARYNQATQPMKTENAN